MFCLLVIRSERLKRKWCDRAVQTAHVTNHTIQKTVWVISFGINSKLVISVTSATEKIPQQQVSLKGRKE